MNQSFKTNESSQIMMKVYQSKQNNRKLLGYKNNLQMREPQKLTDYANYYIIF